MALVLQVTNVPVTFVRENNKENINYGLLLCNA
ncbi:hypothetical protein M2480_002374 [Parabacteroides sp. PFB2-12]|nr:hypothetical protein [Parabacteroides sp. PM6-13]MDH6391379.1 hypothetical protein [Parabacteroides sp. PFB2-12]